MDTDGGGKEFLQDTFLSVINRAICGSYSYIDANDRDKFR
jgi:hypothetical protein